MAVSTRLVGALLFVSFLLLSLCWRSVSASDPLDQTQQTAAAWDGETQTAALSDVSLAEFLTEEAPLTVTDEEPAFKEAAGAAAEGDVVSRRIAGRQHLSSVGKSALFASAAVLVLLAFLRMRGKVQGVEQKKVQQPDAPAGQQQLLPDFEPIELHQLAAAANRVSSLLGGAGLEAAAAELSRRVQDVDRCHAVAHALAQQENIDQVALTKARKQVNEELETLLESTSKFLRQAVDPVRQLKEEASRKAAHLEQEAEAAKQAVKTTPHDSALAQKALTRKFAAGARDSNFTMGNYVSTSMRIAATLPVSLKNATHVVRSLMNNVAHMKQLSARTLEDCHTLDSWKRFSAEPSLKVLKAEGASLRLNLRAILEEVLPKHMTQAAAAVVSQHQETLQTIENLINEAPSEDEMANASHSVLLSMVEKLRTANQRARGEADALLEDIREQLRAQGEGDDPQLYKDDRQTLEAFRMRVMLAGSLSADYTRATTDLVDAASRIPLHPHPQGEREGKQAVLHASQLTKLAIEAQMIARRAEEANSVDAVLRQMKNLHAVQLNAFTEGRKAEELALAKVAWDHLSGVATEMVTGINSMCNTVINSGIISFEANAAKKLQHARALMEDLKKSEEMKRAIQMALELRCIYDELSKSMRYLPGDGASSL
ncbi:hypothetical protein Emed_001741 [Eimeria media]